MKQKIRFKNFANIGIGLKKDISVDLYLILFVCSGNRQKLENQLPVFFWTLFSELKMMKHYSSRKLRGEFLHYVVGNLNLI